MSISVSGGSTSFEAVLDDLESQARLIGDAGGRMRGLSDDVGRATLNGSVVASALLCPVEFGRAEAAVLSATTGPDGVFPTGAGLEAGGLVLKGCSATYRLADELGRDAIEAARTVGGFAIGIGLVGAGVVATGVGLVGAATIAANPLLLGTTLVTAPRLVDALGTLPIGQWVDSTLYANPWIADNLLRELPGMLQGMGWGGSSLFGGSILGPSLLSLATGGRWPTLDYEQAVGGLVALGQRGGYFDDTGTWRVLELRNERGRPPAGVGDIFREQQVLGRDGYEHRVEITTVVGADGVTRFVVQIPGTQDWSPTRTGNPVDMTTNVALMSAEQRTIMERQVEEALKQSIASSGADPSKIQVMLTGHSQGGIAAATLAADDRFRETYHVTSVVTGGSPIARIDIPDSVSVLAVEHGSDVVPKLDGRDNPAKDNWVTVTRDVPASELATDPTLVGGVHGTGHYTDTGRMIDGSTDPSVQAWRAKNDPFLTGQGTTRLYDIAVPVTPQSAGRS